ncbi:MAG: hypothetical protein QM685_00940 [Paraburkholderia sp.]
MQKRQKKKAQRAKPRGQASAGRCRAVGPPVSRVSEPRGTLREQAVLYNEINLLQLEAIVNENVILGIFLVVPLLIVAFLFSDELWQEHRHLHEGRPLHARPRRHDWRHPLRRSRDRP